MTNVALWELGKKREREKPNLSSSIKLKAFRSTLATAVCGGQCITYLCVNFGEMSLHTEKMCETNVTTDQYPNKNSTNENEHTQDELDII